MDILPQECLDNVVSLLDVVSLVRFSATGHYIRSFVLSPRYWQIVDLSNNVHTIDHLFWNYLANRFGDTVKTINPRNTAFQDLKPFIKNFSSLERIICDIEDRELNEHVVINRMVQKAKKILNTINVNQEDKMSALLEDLHVRQARALLWDALWIVLANKHGEEFVLDDEKYFEDIYHDAEWSASLISLLLETEKQMYQPDLQLFPRSIIAPEKIEAMAFITDPRTHHSYLALGIERRILLWDMHSRQCIKTFDTILTMNKESYELMDPSEWTSIIANFDREEQPIILGGSNSRSFCWNFDTSALIYEQKSNESLPSKCAFSKNEWGSTVLLKQNNYLGCKVIDPYTGQIMQEMPNIRKRKAYTSVTANGKFIAVKKSTKNDNGTLTLTIRNIFTNKKEVFRLNGELKSRNAKFACHSFGDELIAVNGGDRKLKIYRRVEKNNEIAYEEVRSNIRSARFIRILSRGFVLADDDICDIILGTRRCSVEVDPYSLEPLPFAFLEQTGLFARAYGRHVALLCDVNTCQNEFVSSSRTRILPNKFTRVKDTLVFHETYRQYDESRSYVTMKIYEKMMDQQDQLPFDITFQDFVTNKEGILIDVTQDKYALVSIQSDKPRQETFRVIDMDTQKAMWEHVVEPRRVLRNGRMQTEYTSGALFVPQSSHVFVSIPGGGFILFDWKENKSIETLENRKFGAPLKLSQSGRYYVVSTSVGYTRTLVYNRAQKSLLLLNTHVNDSEAIDFNPANEDQLAVAGCGVRIFDLKNRVQVKTLTRFVDGQVKVLRESEEIPVVKYSPSGKHLAVIERPSRKPWGLNIAPSILRVYETNKWTMITSLDLGEAVEALCWLDEEHAVIGSTDGKINQMRIVVPEFAHLFKYIIPPDQGKEISLRDVSDWFRNDDPQIEDY